LRQRSDGHGLSGARVEIAEGATQGMRASADAQGRFRLSDLAPGTLTVRAVADGYSATTQSVTLSSDQTLDFTLDQSSTAPPPPGVQTITISGVVTDGRNETAIRGARVAVTAGADRDANTESDANGQYRLTVRPGELTIEVSARGYISQTRHLTAGADDQRLDVELAGDGSGAPGPAGPLVRGTTIDGVSNDAVAGALIRVDGAREFTSGGDGGFELTTAPDDRILEVSISSASTIDRTTRLRVTGGAATLTLIPKSIDLASFDQMFRGDGVLRRWTAPPSVVVQRRVLKFTSIDASSFIATSTVLSDEEVASILADLHEALPELTGDTFEQFANQSSETAAEGEPVDVIRPGVIVVAEYEGLTDAIAYWGYTRWAWNDRGEMQAASMMLDRAFETSGSAYRRSLRAHELGHALGYHHVDRRESVMNASGRLSITDFDRHGARIAFLRPPLNTSPDVDPDPVTVNRAPAARLTWTGDR
jgi:hypothetical protein